MVPTTSPKETSPSSYPQSPTPSSTRKTISSPRKELKKSHWFFRRLASEWHAFVLKLKDLLEPHTSGDEALDSIFESSDDDFIGRSPGKYGQVTQIESQFLLDYKKHRTLEKVYEAHIAKEKNKGGKQFTHQCIEIQPLRSSMLAQPVVQSSPESGFTHPFTQNAIGSPKASESTINGASGTKSTVATLGSNGVNSDINGATLASSIDFENERVSSKTDVVLNFTSPQRRRSTCNLGEKLWEERRNRWLETSLDNAELVSQRQSRLSLAHINSKLHPQIYTMFVEKSKPLKNGARINLEDLVSVINAGWTKDAKWDRAARGLP